MQFIATIQKELHITIEELNLGGGFGICYTEQDDPIPYEQYMEAVSKVIHRCSEEYGVPQLLQIRWYPESANQYDNADHTGAGSCTATLP